VQNCSHLCKLIAQKLQSQRERNKNMEDVMRRAFGCVLCTVLAFSAYPASTAQEPAANPGWETCLQAPTRACILDEALVHASRSSLPRKTLMERLSARPNS
jgi:hypothetical protein